MWVSYSYTQIAAYLSCPRRYRYRYLDGWQDRSTRAALAFGRAFEQALAALFRREDATQVWFEQWSMAKTANLMFATHETWDRMLEQGIVLLQRVAQDGRIRIRPSARQQVQFGRSLHSGQEFVGIVDAIGELDGNKCVLEWKTSSARYAVEPGGLTSLDPQLICYSWLSGIEEVAQVVFVRKRMPEIQYLRATISDQQRREFEALVEDTVPRIEAGLFLPHSGIRFPQNPCTSCSFLGLCLNDRKLVDAGLVRTAGVDRGLFDELTY